MYPGIGASKCPRCNDARELWTTEPPTTPTPGGWAPYPVELVLHVHRFIITEQIDNFAENLNGIVHLADPSANPDGVPEKTHLVGLFVGLFRRALEDFDGLLGLAGLFVHLRELTYGSISQRPLHQKEFCGRLVGEEEARPVDSGRYEMSGRYDIGLPALCNHYCKNVDCSFRIALFVGYVGNAEEGSVAGIGVYGHREG